MKLKLIAFLLILSLKSLAQINDTSSIIKESAGKKINTFLNLIPNGQEPKYGFKTRQDFERVKIEEPIQVYYIKNIKNKLFFVFSNEWRVPFSINGEYISFLTIIEKSGEFEVVDLGGNILAKKIQELNMFLVNNTNKLILIRNTFLNVDYVSNNFEELFTKNAEGNEIKINSDANVYKINENKPIKVSLSEFYQDTIQYLDTIKN